MQFLFIVLAQRCTIRPEHPTTLTSTGGEIVNGTQNVLIKCICPRHRKSRWFFPDGQKIRLRMHMPMNHPYFENPNKLIIPTFTHASNKTYACGSNAHATTSVTFSLLVKPGNVYCVFMFI